MRPSFRNAAAITVILCAADAALGQLVMIPTQASFGRGRASIFVQPRVIPVSPWGYSNGAFGFGTPFYGGFAHWHNGIPFGYNPYPPPPIVIQNIIQAPPGAALPNGRGVVIPPEFDPPVMKAPPKAAKLGPAPRPVEEAIIPRPVPPPPGRAEADRIAESGRKAFADGQYGRALELFRRAAEITPNEPSAYFVIAQAQFARGKYREAVAAIAAGMAIRADWSEARFIARELYWKKPAAFDDQIDALRQAVTAFPDDAGLLFLLGHQLWFDGKHDEARGLIAKARAIGKDQTPAPSFQVDLR